MKKKILIACIFIGIFSLFHFFDLGELLTLDYLKANQTMFADYYQQNRNSTIIYYFLVYVIATAISIPGATILTLAGGAMFGFSTGLVVVSFASTIGATLAFLASRIIFRDFIQSKFSGKLLAINEGMRKEGAFYLFTLRLVPLFPFFIINLVMGLTHIKTFTYFWVSQLGMLAGTAVYINAGVQLSQIENASDILSPALIGSFVLLGVFPLVAKKILATIEVRKIYSQYKKPQKFDYNMVVIGAGAAGLVTSYICAAVKAKVALIEKEKMGGDCLNTGCVPSKALIRSAKAVHMVREAEKFGLKSVQIDFDFAQIMDRVHSVIKKIEPHDSVERYEKLGVECISGDAKIISPWEVEVNGKILTTKNITIATGASPFVPPIPGINEVEILTSNNLWQLKILPSKLVVLGGGPIGLEMAQSFARFGSKVTVVEMLDRILIREDLDVSKLILKRLEFEGLNILTSHKAVQFRRVGEQQFIVCESERGKVEIEFDKCIVAIGRRANIKGFGVEELGIAVRPNGTIEANEFLQTNFPNIYVCGDVTGPFQLTHSAAHQAWYCAVNGLFSPFKKFRVDYRCVPWCTYVDPEVATVGHNETSCKSESISYEVTTFGIDDLDRAITESADYGFVKVLTVPGKDKILGATIVGQNAGELLIEFVTAMKYGLGLNKILGTIHSYPTMAEANKFVAGNWKKANTPGKLLKLISNFHNWRRS